MRIVIASDLFWPTLNGISVFSKNLAEGMSKRGHEVVVFAPSQTGNFYIEEVEGYKIVRLSSLNFPFYHNQTSPLPPPKTIVGSIKMPQIYINNGYRLSLTPYKEIRGYFNRTQFRPDVIHIQLQLTIGQAMMSYASRHNIPVVSTNHSSPENLFDNLKLLAPFSPVINRIVLDYTKRFNVRADYTTMPTQLAINRYYKHPERAKMPVEAVSNGIDLAKFTPEQPPKEFYDRFKLSDKKKYICHIGRVDAEKHISSLVEAFALIADKNPDTDMIIVGDGTDMTHLQNIAYQLKIADRVRFMGTQLGEDLVNFHRLATVFCSPSPTETQGIVFLEAAACGKPVVGVDVGAVKEICQDGVNGFLCEADNYEQIAESLDKILNSKKLRDEFSGASLKIIKHHDLNFTLNKFEEIYQFVLDKKQEESDSKIFNRFAAKFKSKKWF